MPGKIANVDELFPPERIRRGLERHQRFWRGEAAEPPLVCAISWKANYNNVLDLRVLEEKVAATLTFDAGSGGDVIPAFNSMIGTCALASAFGGKTIRSQNGLFWIEPVVVRPDDVYRLKRPGVLDGLVGRSVENYRYIAARLDGYLPPRVPDMQGPLNTASMIWKQEEFLLAMYDAPEAVHHLLGLVTDHIIAVYRYYRDTFPQANLVSWPYLYMPPELGVGMTEDFMHLVTPAQYEAFGLPYVNRIAREFGGVFIHCCGRFRHHWPTVRKIHNLRGLDTMYPYSHPAELNEAFPDVAHSMSLDYAEKTRTFAAQGPHAFLQFMIEHTVPGGRRIFYADATDDPDVLREQIRTIERYGRQGKP